MERQHDHDRELRESVCYWRMSQPQVVDETMKSKRVSNASTGGSGSEFDLDEYEILHPSDRGTQKILDQSTFVQQWMPQTDCVSESLMQFCGSFPIRMGPVIVASLIRRFTDVRFNWETKTLQSFMEVLCWVSVTYVAYSLYEDIRFALQIGTFCGALMSICDEVVLQFVRGLARVIRNQSGGPELLEQLGFDVPKTGKVPTNGHEVELIKNLVFGYLGVVAIRSLYENFHDVKYFALLTAAAGVLFVVTAEFCCLWLPTRRVGLTLQSRFTKIQENWQEHTARSLVELLSWTLSTVYFYSTTQDFLISLRWGTIVAVAVCLLSGLDELPDTVSSDADDTSDGLSFWQDHMGVDPFLAMGKAFVKIQDVVWYVQAAVEDEAMNMYANWSQ